MTVQEIIDALTPNTDRFPREALAAATQHKEELIPHLLNALDYVCDSAEEMMAEDSSYDLYFYAIYLLAQFREKQAFSKLIRLLKKEKEILDYFLGDVITDGSSRCLCSVYDGNLELLKELIEDTNAYEYARNAALETYGFITRGDPVARKEMIDYLRRYIHEQLKDDTSSMPSFVSSVVLEEHIFELIPDIKFLYDRNLIDHFFHGGYDSFLDFIFDYQLETKNIFIDDVIEELQHWAKYQQKPKPQPSLPVEKPPAGDPVQKTKKKIGRNDPCPCNSGKKYKKCCLFLGITRFNDEDDELSEETESQDFFGGLRGMYDESKPYDLMQNYPRRGPPSVEGQRMISEFYSPKALEIDIPVYKALVHRSIPIWVKRNMVKEDMERLDFLLEAFNMFTQTCEEEHLETFADFDRKYMVHYESSNWVGVLNELLEEYADRLSEKKSAARETVKATLARMGGVTERRVKSGIVSPFDD
ncbi:MAG: DUF1186 domain-containing protein [Treponema sp.]|nr:DUF1186 domain-containing protein [Treponema sp.]